VVRINPGQVSPELLEEPHAEYRSGFRVGGVSIQLAGERSDDVVLVPSLEPFRVEAHAADISIQVEWADGLFLSARQPLFDSGATWRLYERESGFQFDFSAPIFGGQPYKRLLVDREFRQATLHMSEESFAGFPNVAEPLEYPLDELLIMHRLTQEKAIELHGCGIVRADGIGNLFVGHSGAGKSTTTRLWTAREGVEVLSDDRIIVRRDGARKDGRLRPRAVAETPFEAGGGAGAYGVLRLRDSSASRSNHFAQDDKVARDGSVGAIRMYGTPWHGEAMFASPGSAPLERMFILEHGRGNVLTRLSKSQAVAELFARAFVPFHRHEYVESAMAFLEEVVETVPCYHFAFEPDQRAVETILRLRD
jgi:hypothetical protein